MNKKRGVKKNLLILLSTTISMVFLPNSNTFSYWAGLISGSSITKNDNVNIGGWIREDATHIEGSAESFMDAIHDDTTPAADKVIVLTNDIEVDFTESSTGEQNLGKFEGIFDGAGHTIVGTLDGSQASGLDNGKHGFGLFSDLAITGTIQNLNLEICLYFTENSGNATDNYYFGGMAAFNSGIIDNVHITAQPSCPCGGMTIDFTNKSNGALVHIGGLVGENKGTITNSSSSIDMTVNYHNRGSVLVGQKQNLFVGGFVGKNVNKNNSHIPVGYRARVENSTVSGKVNIFVDGRKVALEKTTTDVDLGGIIGFNDLGTQSGNSYTGSFPAHLTVTKDTDTERAGTIRIRRYVGNENDS